jgi:hypothetical protein
VKSRVVVSVVVDPSSEKFMLAVKNPALAKVIPGLVAHFVVINTLTNYPVGRIAFLGLAILITVPVVIQYSALC